MLNKSVMTQPKKVPPMLGFHRILVTFIVSSALALLLGLGWTSGFLGLLWRIYAIGFSAMLAFGVFERWPKHLPNWIARWVIQVLAVAVIIPLLVTVIYVASTPVGDPSFWKDSMRLTGFFTLVFTGILIAPWIALAALVKQKDALARHQALAFELERTELKHQALEAHHRLLHAQVSPHFLFNTLANIQALVDTNSPKASEVLRTLINYLRAAVPKLEDTVVTIDREQQLASAYLKLMEMRIPDRLSFSFNIDQATLALYCPPMTLMTLVENAIRHGIDPSETGGHIKVEVTRTNERCKVSVSDTGVGLSHVNNLQNLQTSHGLGSGLDSLKERLTLTFDGDAQLQLHELEPHGVRVDITFPAQQDVSKLGNNKLS